MDATSVFLPLINEALHDFGPWAFIPVGLGVIAWEARRKFQAKDAQIERLHGRIAELQEQRLQDARQLIAIAESGTKATTARSESDQRFADTLEAILRHNMRPGLFGWRR